MIICYSDSGPFSSHLSCIEGCHSKHWA